jgi:hypothetical protein
VSSGVIPAPIDGLNLVANPTDLKPTEATRLVNLLPGQGGSRPRLGYTEFATGAGAGLRSIMGFVGTTPTDQRLFAATDIGIFNISAGGAIPAQLVTFPNATEESGRGTYFSIALIGGRYLIYVDEDNGYYRYEADTDAWTKVTEGVGAGQISGADPADFATGVAFKNRLWFVKKDSGTAYYLPAGVVAGTVTAFEFGNKFPNGGKLAALAVWSKDTSQSLDDRLVAISSNGDVVIYEGSDPDSASTFRQAGAWFVGAPPRGRRLFASYSGDLYILCAFGLLPISRLLSGAEVGEEQTFTTWKIGLEVQAAIKSLGAYSGWEVRVVPSQGTLMISTPPTDGVYTQYVQNVTRQAWCIYEGLPYECGEYYDKTLYVGDADGNVWKHEGYLDGVLSDGTEGEPVEFEYVSYFSDLEQVGHKQVHFARPVFVGEGAPSIKVRALFDYADPYELTVEDAAVVGDSLFDVALFDDATFFGGRVTTQKTYGVSGVGLVCAIQITGNAAADMRYIRSDILMSEVGGFV